MTLFQRAQRTQAKLRLAIDGPSGSGKTYSALLIAKGLASGDLSRVALIDTERGSGSLYADLGPYSVLDFEPPYSVDRYVKAMTAAAQEGFEVIVIDSLTHAWSGEGGILDYVDAVAKAQTHGNSFAAWKQGSPLQKKLVDTILASPCHVIGTMRSKTEYVIEENEKGKKAPRKVGLAPDQRKDFEYEMTIVLDLSREHIATASKDRTGLFDDRLEVPSEAMGAELLAWLGSAAPERPHAAVPEAAPETEAGSPESDETTYAGITRTQAQNLHEALFAKGYQSSWFLTRLADKGIGDGSRLTSIPASEYDALVTVVQGFPDKAASATQEAESAAPAPEAADVPAEPDVPPADERDEDGLSAKDRQFLADTEMNGRRTPPQPTGKKGTVTPPQLTRLGALCSDLEAEGIGRDEWRLWLFEHEGVASRTELTKTAAMRVIDAFNRWHIDLATGVEVGA